MAIWRKEKNHDTGGDLFWQDCAGIQKYNEQLVQG